MAPDGLSPTTATERRCSVNHNVPSLTGHRSSLLVSHVPGTVKEWGSVRVDVAAGKILAGFLQLARRAALLATQTQPSPTGTSAWSQEDVDDLVMDTIVRVSTDKVVLAAIQAANDAQFYAWLRKVTRTTLDIRSRKTSGGKVIQAVYKALHEDTERFGYEAKAGYWRLVDDDREPSWSGGITRLVEVAWSVETPTTTLKGSATQAGRLANREDTRAVAEAVLEVAGPLAKADLAELIAHRFNVAFTEEFRSLSGDGDNDEEEPPVPEQSAIDDVNLDDAAKWLLEQLSSEERDLLRDRASGTVRDLVRPGRGRSTVAKLSKRLEEKVRLIADRLGEDRRDVVARALHILGQEVTSEHSTDQDDGDLDDS